MLEKSAGAVIFFNKQGKIYYLVLHYEWGHWGFVKGNIEKQEDLKQTVKREIKEEAGLDNIEFINGFKEHIKYFYKLKGKNVFKIVTFFLVESKTDKVVLSYEHQDYKWLEYEDALKQLSFKNSKQVLKKANVYISEKGL